MNLERVSNLSQEDFMNNYLLPNKPVIITDAMDSWDISQFQPDSLIEKFGDELVQVYDELSVLRNVISLEDYFKDNFGKQEGDGQSSDYVRWYNKLKDVDFFWSDEIFAKLKPFWNHAPFLPKNAMALPFYDQDSYVDCTESRHPYRGIFISGRGARTRLHRDPINTNAILCQFYGEKKIYLYHPDQAKYLMNGTEFVDATQPDLDKFPDFPKAKCQYEATLRPGEMVFFASGWFHDVRGLSDSVSITWNFIHSRELERFISYLRKYPNDSELGTIRYFLNGLVKEDANAEDIVEALTNKFPTAALLSKESV